MDLHVVTHHHSPFLTSNMSFYQHCDMQIAGETFDTIQSDVLQGSKVILDVEEEGLDKRSILSLDAATEISSSGRTCFRSSDGKEHCFAKAQPGACNSFAGPEGHRRLFSSDLWGPDNNEYVWFELTDSQLAESASAMLPSRVRVQLAGTNYLNMNEVQVIDLNGVNVALNKPATQSSTFGSYTASNAVNGRNYVSDTGSMTNNEKSTYHTQERLALQIMSF